MYTLAERAIKHQHRRIDCDKENTAPPLHHATTTMPAAGHMLRKPCQNMSMREPTVVTAPFKTRTRQPLAQGKEKSFLNTLANRADPTHLKASSSWDEYDCSVALLNLAQQEPKAAHASPDSSHRTRTVYCHSGPATIRSRKQISSSSTPKRKQVLGNGKVTFHRTKTLNTSTSANAKQLRKLEIGCGGRLKATHAMNSLPLPRHKGVAVNLGDRFRVLKMPSELVKRPPPGQKMDLRIKWR